MTRRSLPPAPAVPFASLIAAILAVAAPARAGIPGPIAPPGIDADIAALADSVSADSLEATIQTLQDFFTRHTNSDTVSTTVGIGAARRWVYEQFAAISAANGGNLQVAFDTFNATVSGVTRDHRNVVATLPGTDPQAAERIFVFSGHLDSRNANNTDAVGYAPGANDDGSGVGAAIELARLMARRSWEATIKFIAFTGEEQGLFGSAHYASVAALHGDNIEGDLNSDIIGNVTNGDPMIGDSLGFDSTHVRMYSDSPSTSSSRQMGRLVKICGEAYVPTMGVILYPLQDRPGRGGDHISFNTHGFTACRLVDVFDNMMHQHTAGDSIEVMNFPYFARNVRINLATLGNLARAPRPVADVVAGNLGDSTGFVVTWSANPEADLAGYRVTIRSLDSLQYETATDLGNVLMTTVTSPPAASVAIGIAAYDSAGHLGIATEVVAVLSSVPLAPTGIAAHPNAIRIRVDWTDSPEEDLAGYNVWRAPATGGPYTKQNVPLVVPSEFDDFAVSPLTFYYYKVSAVDSAGNESPLSTIARGRLATRDQGILLFDETAAQGGQPHLPTEAQSDTAYAHALQDFPHATFDFDSVQQAGGLTVSDLGIYSSVIWISDDRNSLINGQPIVVQKLKDNTAAIAEYLDVGGKVLLLGWRQVGGFDEAYPVTYGPGDFLYDYFRVGSTSVSGPGQYCWGATGLGSYTSVVVDTSRARTPWVGKLPDMEYITSIASGGETVYTFRSSAADSVFANAPNGIRYNSGVFKTQFFDFPLYHLREADARVMIQRALGFFSEPPTGVESVDEDAGAAPGRFALWNGPNPGRHGTVIGYSLPQDADVELSIFSPSGERVRLLDKGRREAGRRVIAWDGRNDSGREVASGVYLYRLHAGPREITKKLAIIR